MPVPLQHAGRINEADRYFRFCLSANQMAEGVHGFYGVTHEGIKELQEIRFSAERYTEDEAQKWLEDNNRSVIAFEAAGTATEGSIALRPSTQTPWEETQSGKTSDGVMRKRFRKEIAKAGTYITPDGVKHNITRERIQHWAKTDSMRRANGYKVPLSSTPTAHVGAESASASRGKFYDMTAEGDSLYGHVEVIGQDAIEEAVRNEVSVYSPPEWTDGKGNAYKMPITHVALTSFPVISNLGEWQAIAASLSTGNEDPTKDKDGKPSTEKGSQAMELKDVQTIAAALKIEDADKITDETALDVISKGIVAFSTSLTEKTEEIATLKGQKTTLAASLADATKEDEKPNDQVVALSLRLRNADLDGLVKDAKLTPAGREVLGVAFSGEAIALSLDKQGTNLFDTVVKVLRDNDPVKLTEQSGRQVVALSTERGTGAMDSNGDDALSRSAKRIAADAKDRA